MPQTLVKMERQGPVAVVTMDNPPTMNAMDNVLGPQLVAVLESLLNDPDARAVVLTGAGGNFTGGGNLKRAGRFVMENPGKGAGVVFASYLQFVVRVVQALAGLPQPVISAVEGASSGAGLAWMLASDLVVAAEDARILPGFVAVGLVPAAGSTWHLPRLVGLARASEMFMLNRPIKPETALELGLVQRLVPPGTALDEALEMAHELAVGPRHAMTATKRRLGDAARRGMAPHLEKERQAVVMAADQTDFLERVRRFVEAANRKEG